MGEDKWVEAWADTKDGGIRYYAREKLSWHGWNWTAAFHAAQDRANYLASRHD